MVLVDTSVWIRFLSNRQPWAAEMARLLEHDLVAGHHMVYGELLIGDAGGRAQLLESYRHIVHAAVVPHLEVVEFVHLRKLNGRGVGWIDTHLLASSLVSRMKLWTADTRCDSLAQELGVAHKIGV